MWWIADVEPTDCHKCHLQLKEIDITNDPAAQLEMVERSGRKTVPQIFIDGESIGGCDDLYELYESGKLEL
ncbi:Glutaredoxin-3 [Anaplasma phagocytophilum]|uniref:Glutaredoxin-3 n=2 Tax=Anaplasma phagocytophilum TaxID=948 RepID=A0AA45UU73_ANAPH|nr:glutaredoxin domain-containing protein [Anaplasma phagocytophilum]ANC34602.1 glutaredoxin [Anaplasma phagocytophilum str. Norway variant2]SBO14640.1 Glutaredoxin-3 [Anaplasma phagocytophilum]SBO32876.1 Glutaredoxin-3 [Anaplasma phagocytophilum]SBO32878.1 Glutaredoxin-3 [Anaplasma phagocytophilum]SBO33541.1 Glutaredoxin-3 [Anaplasma phagocytophilum]